MMQGLPCFNFFPNNEDWERFRAFSYAQRVSVTLLFVMLLVAWNNFENKKNRVPKFPDKIHVNLSLNIFEVFTYLELEHLNL